MSSSSPILSASDAAMFDFTGVCVRGEYPEHYNIPSDHVQRMLMTSFPSPTRRTISSSPLLNALFLSCMISIARHRIVSEISISLRRFGENGRKLNSIRIVDPERTRDNDGTSSAASGTFPTMALANLFEQERTRKVRSRTRTV